nr:hypothetical protein [Tanacetum cinerariifolium]
MEAQYGKFLDMIQAVRINVPLVNVLAGIPNYGKLLKELVKSKVPLILGRRFLHTADAVIRVKQKQLNLGVGTEHMTFHMDSAMKHSYSNDDTCFSIDIFDEILKEDFEALLDEGSKILHSFEGTILKEKFFTEFDEFIAMTAKEDSRSEFDIEEPPFEKITFNTDYKIKTCLEDPPTDLELKALHDNIDMYSWKNLLFFLMDNPNITMEEYIRLEKEVAQKHRKMFNWETTKYGKIWFDEDVHDLRSVETKFPAIVFNDKLSPNETLSYKPTISSPNNNKIDFRISFDESDDKDYTFDPKWYYKDCVHTSMLRRPRREVHRVQVFDFEGFPDLMAKGLRGRMLIEHQDAQGQIMHGTDDTWAWVAPGLDRQHVAAAGAREAVDDAPIADKGASAVPAPMWAPQPPPPVARPARTMDGCWTLTDDESGWGQNNTGSKFSNIARGYISEPSALSRLESGIEKREHLQECES